MDMYEAHIIPYMKMLHKGHICGTDADSTSRQLKDDRGTYPGISQVSYDTDDTV